MMRHIHTIFWVLFENHHIESNLEYHNSMDRRGKITVISLIFALSFVMTQFQNCAPQSAESLQAQSGDSNADSEVRIVDDWIEDKVVFVQPQLDIKVEVADVELYGFCDRKAIGNEYSWAIFSEDEESNVVIDGDSICERGGFRVQFDHSDSLKCGQSYKVYINDENGPRDVMFISKSCG